LDSGDFCVISAYASANHTASPACARKFPANHSKCPPTKLRGTGGHLFGYSVPKSYGVQQGRLLPPREVRAGLAEPDLIKGMSLGWKWGGRTWSPKNLPAARGCCTPLRRPIPGHSHPFALRPPPPPSSSPLFSFIG
jgi:hypothetical protein